jgi:hypothetical protein
MTVMVHFLRFRRGVPEVVFTRTYPERMSTRPSTEQLLLEAVGRPFEIGEAVSYAEDGKPEMWAGGFEIVGLNPVQGGGRRYAIRSAGESFDRIVQQHELCEDLGARGRGQ